MEFPGMVTFLKPSNQSKQTSRMDLFWLVIKREYTDGKCCIQILNKCKYFFEKAEQI